MWTEPLEFRRLSIASFVDELRAQPIPRRRDRHGAQG
jgi:hypothetical protein